MNTNYKKKYLKYKLKYLSLDEYVNNNKYISLDEYVIKQNILDDDKKEKCKQKKCENKKIN